MSFRLAGDQPTKWSSYRDFRPFRKDGDGKRERKGCGPSKNRECDKEGAIRKKKKRKNLVLLHVFDVSTFSNSSAGRAPRAYQKRTAPTEVRWAGGRARDKNKKDEKGKSEKKNLPKKKKRTRIVEIRKLINIVFHAGGRYSRARVRV